MLIGSVRPPSSRLIGRHRPFWTLDEVYCPEGRLLCAVCPDMPPEAVIASFKPAEVQYASTLGGDRRREWLAGRYCLAAALEGPGFTRPPLLTSMNGAAAVPDGTVGSIAHKGPLSVALVNQGCCGVGVDVEYSEEADLRLYAKVFTAQERSTFDAIADAGEAVRLVTIHFSVKEAIYKSIHPADQPKLDFDAIHLAVNPDCLSREGEWLTIPAHVDGIDDRIDSSVRLDGNWVLSTAKRH